MTDVEYLRSQLKSWRDGQSKNLQNCLTERLKLFKNVKESNEVRVIVDTLARTDVTFWINNFVWTYDPRVKPPFLPMQLFPMQEDLLRFVNNCYTYKHPGVVVKSRDTGATVTICMYMLHKWLFEEGFKGGIGSRKEDLVDKKGDPDCIFEKLRFALSRLPEWQLPQAFTVSGDYDNFCKLINPQNGSTVTGEAGPQIGRGGRSSLYLVDESAFLDSPKTVEASLAANTDVRIDVSTPNGMGNPFYQKAHNGHVPRFDMDWHDDPRRNFTIPDPVNPANKIYPWYEIEKYTINDPVIIAREYDRDFAASVSGIAIPLMHIRSAENLHNDYPEVEFAAEQFMTVAGLDVAGESDDGESVLTIRTGPIIVAQYAWVKTGTTGTALKAIDLCHKHNVTWLFYDSAGVGAGVGSTLRIAREEKKIKFSFQGINAGSVPTNKIWPDKRKSKEKFRFLKDELWFIARQRFEMTHEYRSGIPHSPQFLISIPRQMDVLSFQLSSLQIFEMENGKIRVESKKELRTRGVKSPDRADSFILTFASPPKYFDAEVGHYNPEYSLYD